MNWWTLVGATLSMAAPMLLAFLVLPFQGRAVDVDLGAFLVNTAVYTFCVANCLLLHEVAHALAAGLLKMEVLRVNLGIGRQIARFRVRQTLVQILLMPLYGFVITVPRSRGAIRLRYWLVAGAGPAFNAAVCLALLPLLEPSPSGLPSLHLAERFDPILALFAANLFLLLVNLFPANTRSGPSDGRSLLSLPFKDRAELENYGEVRVLFRNLEAVEEKRLSDSLEILEQGLRDHPDSLPLRYDRAKALSRLDRRGEARAQYEELLDHPDVRGPSRAVIQNNIASSILLCEDRGRDLEVAEQLSSRALEVLPWEPFVLGTRGGVLAFGGDSARAIPLLQQASESTSSVRGRAENAAWLALAHDRAGQPQRSRAALELSRDLAPANPALAIVAELLEGRGPREA